MLPIPQAKAAAHLAAEEAKRLKAEEKEKERVQRLAMEQAATAGIVPQPTVATAAAAAVGATTTGAVITP